MTASIKTRTPDQPTIGTANDPSGAIDRETSWSTGPAPEKQPLPAADKDDSGPRAPVSRDVKEPVLAAGLPHYRAIVAIDIERSTSRPDPVKAELRNKTYELFDAALYSAGIHKRHRYW
jgi:hypothetical protein